MIKPVIKPLGSHNSETKSRLKMKFCTDAYFFCDALSENKLEDTQGPLKLLYSIVNQKFFSEKEKKTSFLVQV